MSCNSCNKGVVYRVVSLKTGKYYIGSTLNFHTRIVRHKRELVNGTHHSFKMLEEFYNYGLDNFKFEILEEGLDKTILKEREQHFIDKEDFDNLLNVCKHAVFGDTLSYHPHKEEIVSRIKNTLKKNYSLLSDEERKQKHAKYGEHNGNWKGGVSKKFCKCGKRIGCSNKTCRDCQDKTGKNNPFYGKKHSKETIEKIKQANLGRLPKNGKIVEIFGIRYNSISEASRKIGLSDVTIRKRLDKVDGYKSIKA